MTGALSREGACFLRGREKLNAEARSLRGDRREREREGEEFTTETQRGTQRPRRVSPRELNLNPRQAIRAQQQRQFPGVG